MAQVGKTANHRPQRTLGQGTENNDETHIEIMRYYLDTNILAFLLQKQRNELHPNTISIIEDYSNVLITSSVCVAELIHLCHIEKVFNDSRKRTLESAEAILPWLKEMWIEIVPVNDLHLHHYAALSLRDDHRDPNDRLIIAQAISDRIPLISSDHRFFDYEKNGLEFIYNER